MRMVKAIVSMALAAGLVAGTATAAELQSSYGCVGLAGEGDLQVIEGSDGFFFTVSDDIAMQSVADPALVKNIAALSAELKSHGTVLVYAPVPSRSQALSDKVPQSAWIYGYDEKINAEIYQEAIERLKSAGVVAIDLLTPLRADAGEKPSFQQVDPLWTTEGAKRAAETIAAQIVAMPEARKANLMTFTTTAGEDYTRRSDLREAIQPHCSETLPPVSETRYETEGEEAFAADRPFNIFGAEAPAPVVLVGSRFSAEGQSHFDGFLKQSSLMNVDNRSGTDGNPFTALANYLGSGDFQSNPPLFLVWEVPPASRLASYGPDPWATLSARINGDCGAEACGTEEKE
ncbi:alginate O-acetyltransferase AlgX-related protein [Martelella limonii]|uniref:alginate O-acetyltransferase AlgX-related protein n=1 Tax=Martelella limonii TaxID=1647649 RepID=UPI001580A228|nr:hypothetical protein [Martelella limonii]